MSEAIQATVQLVEVPPPPPPSRSTGISGCSDAMGDATVMVMNASIIVRV
ncbi:hypothetical protein PHLCEN_2v11679 [Hermanssonia centrifuga]|uniref:Uncharacterized protein n=1 Tax=Hermanssonia centrifuga TaxID=98765 RepID=A0A2R6NJA1_9APHY|nr:hypothetical protein PHLCEN_2v11679 [Hermanssonia centrifuga]